MGFWLGLCFQDARQDPVLSKELLHPHVASIRLVQCRFAISYRPKKDGRLRAVRVSPIELHQSSKDDQSNRITMDL